MDSGTASVVRTLIKTAGVVVIFIGWPKIRKPNIFNQTVIQPSEAEDLVMRSVILELSGSQDQNELITFRRVQREDGVPKISTDLYAMRVEDWEAAGKPDSISVTVSSLVSGVGV